MKWHEFAALLNGSPDRKLLNFRAEFKALVNSIDLESMLLEELDRCARDYRHPPNIRSGFSVILGKGDWFMLELIAIESRSFDDIVCTEPSDSMYQFLTPVKRRKYRLKDFDRNTFDDSARAVLESEDQLPEAARWLSTLIGRWSP